MQGNDETATRLCQTVSVNDIMLYKWVYIISLNENHSMLLQTTIVDGMIQIYNANYCKNYTIFFFFCNKKIP